MVCLQRKNWQPAKRTWSYPVRTWPALSLRVVQRNVINVRSLQRHLLLAPAGRTGSTCLTLPASCGTTSLPLNQPCQQWAGIPVVVILVWSWSMEAPKLPGRIFKSIILPIWTDTMVGKLLYLHGHWCLPCSRPSFAGVLLPEGPAEWLDQAKLH